MEQKPIRFIGRKDTIEEHGIADLPQFAGRTDLALVPTTSPEELKDKVRTACNERAERIIAVGGDGTLNLVMRVMAEMDSPCPVGILPCGTGNDFATAAGIDAADLEAAMYVALHAEPVHIDTGTINGSMFVNAATGGFGAKITTETPQDTKRILGRFAYFLTGIEQFTTLEPQETELAFEDETWHGGLLGFAVCNGRSTGGGVLLAPDAHVNDGIFEVVAFPEMTAGEMAGSITRFLTGTPPSDIDSILSFRSAALTVSSSSEMQVNLDGEPLTDTTFTFEMQHERLPFLLPEESPVLKS